MNESRCFLTKLLFKMSQASEPAWCDMCVTEKLRMCLHVCVCVCVCIVCVHACAWVPMCVGVHSTAARGSDLKQAIACCENIIASVYYCFGVKQWECCVRCTGCVEG